MTDGANTHTCTGREETQEGEEGHGKLDGMCSLGRIDSKSMHTHTVTHWTDEAT